MSTFQNHAPFVLCPSCLYANSRSHGSQMDPSYMRQWFERSFFIAGLEKGGGWMVIRLLAVGGG